MNAPAPKVVLVTGAGGGIGSAVARRFAAGGWHVLATDIDATALGTLAGGIGCGSFVADVRDPAACRDVLAWALRVAGRLDGLVNAAGVWREGATADTAEGDYDLVFGVNVKGLYFLTAAAIPALAATGGFVTNISSDAGIQGNAGAALYCASKGAVSLFTKALALELAPQGVRVNGVCPGDVATPMLEFQARTYGGGDREGYFARLLAGYPQGPGRARFITPEEIAGLVHYLAQPEAQAITGALLSMDFGYSAGKF